MKLNKAQKMAWIESNLDLEEYTLEQIADEIQNVAFNHYELKRAGSYQKALSEMLSGLPSWSSLPFTNYEILKLRDEWGYQTKDEVFLNNWWNACAAQLIQYFNSKKIKLF